MLSNVIAPPFRVGNGEITDQTGSTSGQLDIVIEYASSISFPLLRGDSSRLYLAEGVCAVIEVKSNVATEWSDVLRKAEKLSQLKRVPGTTGFVDPEPPKRIPFFAVGYKGADSAYRSAEIEAKLGEKGLKSRIHRKGHRNKPLNEREKRGNETRSKVRARVEHVFRAQSNDMGGTLVRGIGLVRAKARIGLKNLAYNMRRLVQLERLAAAALP